MPKISKAKSAKRKERRAKISSISKQAHALTKDELKKVKGGASIKWGDGTAAVSQRTNT